LPIEGEYAARLLAERPQPLHREKVHVREGLDLGRAADVDGVRVLEQHLGRGIGDARQQREGQDLRVGEAFDVAGDAGRIATGAHVHVGALDEGGAAHIDLVDAMA
jgi:hypothetical protein